jgi:hypothetical protein
MNQDAGMTNPLIVDSSDPVATSWVSREHWLRGSQVSKARPGAPFAFPGRNRFGAPGAGDRYMSATKEAVEQHGENDAADQDVDLVLLDRKTVDAKSDTHDWGRDQKQNT